MDQRYRVGIIGGGPSGITALKQLVTKLIQFDISNVDIFIYDRYGEWGAGLAFGTNDSNHLLRLPKQLMSVCPRKPDDFANWLTQNANNLSTRYPGIDIANDKFLPRKLFGEYLSSMTKSLIYESSRCGINIHFIRGEVCNLLPANGRWTVEYLAANMQKVIMDYVILCTGHLPSTTFLSLMKYPGYYHNPWSNDILEIPRGDEVCIIGSRTTAIDTALKLTSQGHYGKITLASRSGRLPAVIEDIQPYQKRYLTINNILQNTNDESSKLTLKQVEQLFWQELAEVSKVSAINKLPRVNAKLLLQKEIELINSNVQHFWQDVLFSVSRDIPVIWQSMSEAAQRDFLGSYYNYWQTYSMGMPLAVAKQVQQLFKRQVLHVSSGLQSVSYLTKDKIFDLKLRNKQHNEMTKFKWIINGTGPGNDVTLSKSLLLTNLLRYHLIAPHPLGGIKVAGQSLKVIGKHSHFNSLYAVGDITRGMFLATNDIGQLSRQLDIVTHSILSQIVRHIASKSVNVTDTKTNGNVVLQN